MTLGNYLYKKQYPIFNIESADSYWVILKIPWLSKATCGWQWGLFFYAVTHNTMPPLSWCPTPHRQNPETWKNRIWKRENSVTKKIAKCFHFYFYNWRSELKFSMSNYIFSNEQNCCPLSGGGDYRDLKGRSIPLQIKHKVTAWLIFESHL